jgi:DNA-binding transcriptional LysR family regulator
MDRFEQMRLFTAVVDAGGFSAAAERLDLAKSVVSRRVSELENRLGVRLLNRTTRRISLTENGRLFHRRATALLTELEETEAEITQAQGALRGRLRIACPMSFGLLHLSAAVSDFMTAHPGLVPDLDLNDRQVDLVHEGLDLAVRIGELADSSLIARRLSPIRRLLCASPGYLETHGEPRRPMELERHPLLHYSNLPQRQNLRFPAPGGQFLSPRMTPAMQANNGQVLVDAAVADRGIVVSPSFIVYREIRSGALKPILTDHPLPVLGLYVVYPSNRNLSQRARVFMDFLAGRFGDLPYWDR